MRVCLCDRVCMCVYAYEDACTRICVCTPLCLHVYVYVYACVYVYV